MKKEIERRFLLKELPVMPFASEIQHIIQYYYLVNDVWYRIRKINSNIEENNDIYLHTIKTYKDGICYEEECLYSYDDYRFLIKDIHTGKYKSTFLSKTRYVYNTGIKTDFEGEIKDIKWEIDDFNFDLVIAELELPDINFPIKIPDFIRNKIIYEVTSIKEFSNRNLSEPVKLEFLNKKI